MSAGGSLDRGELNSLQLKLNAAAGQLRAARVALRPTS